MPNSTLSVIILVNVVAHMNSANTMHMEGVGITIKKFAQHSATSLVLLPTKILQHLPTKPTNRITI